MQDLKSELVKEIWNKKTDYYDKAAKGNSNIDNNYTYRRIKNLAKNLDKILDVGCGEGTVLNYINGSKKTTLFGIDISPLAIKTAIQKFPYYNFKVSEGRTIPYENNTFDLVLTTYTLEHLITPLDTIEEMIRVTRDRGYCIFLCPNYGSPIFASPCYKKNRITRLIKGFIKDIYLLFSKTQSSLMWESVDPIIDKDDKHYMDHDTTIEPYVLSLKTYISKNTQHKIIELSSEWKAVCKANGWSNLFQIFSFPFKFLGQYLNIYPFKYWGPTLFFIVKVNK